MNFFAIPTLKNVRACFRLPISMMPRFSLKLMLARLRTGIDRVGSRRSSAAVITTSATPTSFFSTAPDVFALARAMFPSISSCVSAPWLICALPPSWCAWPRWWTGPPPPWPCPCPCVAPAELALGPLAPPQEYAEPAPAFLQRELDLLADLVVVGDRFLGLAGERHPD